MTCTDTHEDQLSRETQASFWKPFNVTLDFIDMNVYIARGKAA